jgi:acetyltransferase-like isoleucine patch superfamily enzyme
MSNSAICCANKITFGENVMIGGGCKIWDSDFHPINPTQRNLTPNTNYLSKEIKIGNNVFIGGCSIILKGVTIGDNSVVGAGSVVTKSIPFNEIWAGNPATFIKKNNVD